MFQQLLVALALASVTVIIHVSGTVYAVLPASGLWSRTERRPLPGPVLGLTRLVSALLVLHVMEMIVWAAAFAMCGVSPDFETALYYSLTSYTTVGYGDVLPPPSWRLLGPIEAAVGVLMLGLSTSVIVAGVQRVYSGRSEAPTTQRAPPSE